MHCRVVAKLSGSRLWVKFVQDRDCSRYQSNFAPFARAKFCGVPEETVQSLNVTHQMEKIQH
jgi:hypothetical protein